MTQHCPLATLLALAQTPEHPRSQPPVLRLPHYTAHETTYTVGPSGCGKSTIGALLLRQYAPPSESNGNLLLDGQDIQYLHPSWMRHRVTGVVQGSAGQGAQIFEEVYTGMLRLALSGAVDVSRMWEEVCEACRIAMLEGMG